MHISITILKALVNPMETDTEWSPCKELSNERNAIIAKGDTKANKKSVIPSRSPMLLNNTGTKGSVPMTGTPDVSVTTSGAQAGTAGCTPASQPKPKLRHKIHF